MSGWIAVDLDGTLAHYDGWKGAEHVGDPIAPMLERVRRWLGEGKEVRIFTARCFPIVAHDAESNEFLALPGHPDDGVAQAAAAIIAIQDWCKKHIGCVLPITCMKDFHMLELWDDRAVQVRQNTGEVAGFSTRGHAS